MIEAEPAAPTAPAWILMDAHVIAHAITAVDAIRVPTCHYLSAQHLINICCFLILFSRHPPSRRLGVGVGGGVEEEEEGLD